MKRLLVIIIPLLLLILLNACDTDRLPPLSQRQMAAIQQTLQVTAMPQSLRVMNLLNNRLDYDKFDQLEDNLFGKYDVIGVDFPYGTYFQVNMNCQCADGSKCCEPRLMFFTAVQRISQARDQILADVPQTVQNLDVVCYNNNYAFAVIMAPWQTVKDFLNNPQANAADLSSSVSPPQPMP
jgi:hypothetical protein